MIIDRNDGQAMSLIAEKEKKMTTWFRQKTRKILAGALSVMMAITAVPSAAFANQPEQVVPHLGTARK